MFYFKNELFYSKSKFNFLPLNFKKALIYKGFTDKDFICKKHLN